MISLQITDIKDFMAKLLKTDLFDHFLMPEAVITTSVTCHIDGTLNTSFFATERTLDRAVFPVPAELF